MGDSDLSFGYPIAILAVVDSLGHGGWIRERYVSRKISVRLCRAGYFAGSCPDAATTWILECPRWDLARIAPSRIAPLFNLALSDADDR
jgi:hypothetical protein